MEGAALCTNNACQISSNTSDNACIVQECTLFKRAVESSTLTFVQKASGMFALEGLEQTKAYNKVRNRVYKFLPLTQISTSLPKMFAYLVLDYETNTGKIQGWSQWVGREATALGPSPEGSLQM